jgi:hypothetical protein
MAAMVTPLRIVLHAVRIVLLVALILQAIRLPPLFHHLFSGGADPFAVSPFLLPALLFKAGLLSANVLLLWLAHRALVRMRRRPSSRQTSTIHGAFP